MLLQAFYPKPEVASKQLVHACGMLRVDSNDRNLDQPTGSESPKMEYILLETLLVLTLQSFSSSTIAYYNAVLYHLFKADSSKFSPVFAILIELLFREIPTMNGNASSAFVQTFSHFLSNFEYKWRWSHWNHILKEEDDDPQRLFVASVIEKCVRLSYLDHMQKSLPEELHVLLPPTPAPRVRYLDTLKTEPNDGEIPSSFQTAFFESVRSKLKEHPTASNLESWLKEQINKAEVDRLEAIEVFVTALLESGAATFTHLRLVLEKYAEVFTDPESTLSGSDEQVRIITALSSVWQHSPQHIEVISNLMLRQNIISSAAIIKWIFTADVTQQYCWPYVWTIARDAMTFLQNRRKQTEQCAKAADSDIGDNILRPVSEEEKQVMRSMLEGFRDVLSSHKRRCASDGNSYQDHWFNSLVTQIKAFAIRFQETLPQAIDDIQQMPVSEEHDGDFTSVLRMLRVSLAFPSDL